MAVTKEILDDYRFKLLELRNMETGKKIVTDTVTGSSSEFPYTKHPISVNGVPETSKNLYKHVKKQYKEVEVFISRLPNSYYRTLVRLRVIDGLEWKDIGVKLGKKEGAVKMSFNRMLKKLK